MNYIVDLLHRRRLYILLYCILYILNLRQTAFNEITKVKDSQTTWKKNYKIGKIKIEYINEKVVVESYIEIECQTYMYYLLYNIIACIAFRLINRRKINFCFRIQTF